MATALDRPGRFKAKPADWGMKTTRDSGIPEFWIEFFITDIWADNDWQDWSEYGQSIAGFFYPFKKGGDPNSKTIDTLKDCLGWDGTSLTSLAEGNWSGQVVQITVEDEEYNGKKKLKVKWMNTEDSSPGLKKMDSTEVKSMASNWDAKLRAMNGAPPAKTPARPPAPAKKA